MATQYDRPASVRRLDRAVFGDRHGVPWWAAVLIAVAVTTAGLVLDLEIQTEPGLTFKACYFLGCVAAVCLVKRRALFGPVVQPPLILAIAVPGIILATTRRPAGVLDVVEPLVQGFPTMAITTGVVLLIGLFRLLRERDPKKRKTPVDPANERTEVRKPPGRGTRPPRKPAGR
jgi:hypothetical protein